VIDQKRRGIGRTALGVRIGQLTQGCRFRTDPRSFKAHLPKASRFFGGLRARGPLCSKRPKVVVAKIARATVAQDSRCIFSADCVMRPCEVLPGGKRFTTKRGPSMIPYKVEKDKESGKKEKKKNIATRTRMDGRLIEGPGAVFFPQCGPTVSCRQN